MSTSIWRDILMTGDGEAPAVAASEPMREAAGTTIDPDEDQWRRLTGDATRDLTPLTQARMQKIAHWLWEQNLLANRLIELPVAYILAEGVKLTVKDPEQQKLLDRFWLDPINEMDLKLPKKVRELGIFGEQCYPAFINGGNGHVRIGYLDPALIETVVTDPGNPEQPIGVVTCKDRKGKARRYKVIINGPEDVFSSRTQQIRASFTDGEAFYFRINDLSSGTRGRSDLLAQADWLDAYDQFLFGELDRHGALRAFFWDVTLKNATPDQVKARAKEISAPKSGSVRVHNDSEEWSAEAPNLQASDTSVGARMFRNHVLGGATLPEHWFGGGGDVNRATGESMGEPTFKVLSMRQRFVKHMLESIGRYVLIQAEPSRNVDWSDEKFKVEAVMPELTSTDTTKYAQALQQVVVAVATAIDKGLMTESTGVKVIGAIAGRLGVEFDAEAELKAAQAEAQKRKDERDDADAFTQPSAGEGEEALLQEALNVIEDFKRNAGEQLAGMGDLVNRANAGDQGAIEALREATVSMAENMARLVEAIAAGQKVELTLKHGKTEKTIHVPGKGEFRLTEKDAG